MSLIPVSIRPGPRVLSADRRERIPILLTKAEGGRQLWVPRDGEVKAEVAESTAQDLVWSGWEVSGDFNNPNGSPKKNPKPAKAEPPAEQEG